MKHLALIWLAVLSVLLVVPASAGTGSKKSKDDASTPGETTDADGMSAAERWQKERHNYRSAGGYAAAEAPGVRCAGVTDLTGKRELDVWRHRDNSSCSSLDVLQYSGMAAGLFAPAFLAEMARTNDEFPGQFPTGGAQTPRIEEQILVGTWGTHYFCRLELEADIVLHAALGADADLMKALPKLRETCSLDWYGGAAQDGKKEGTTGSKTKSGSKTGSKKTKK